MKLGLSVYDIHAREFVELARAADEAGFDAIWLGEHIVLPVDYASAHPTAGHSAHQHHAGAIVQRATKLLDPLVALSAAASVTERIRLATAIYIAPLRHPLVTARATATLHDVSGGRLMLGLGSGWLEEEFTALGVPFTDRGRRLDECLQILRQAWSGATFQHHGQCYSFDEVQVCPEPVGIPTILGGNSERALRRAAMEADGWFTSGTPDLGDAIRLRKRLRELLVEHGRDPDLPVWARVPRGDLKVLDDYRAANFENAVIWADELWPSDGVLTDKRRRFLDAAAELGLRDAEDHDA